jgi:hypothetical protein
MKARIVVTVLATTLLLAFQNCSEVSFGPASGSLLAKIDTDEVVAMADGDEDAPGDEVPGDDVPAPGDDDNGGEDITPPGEELPGDDVADNDDDAPGDDVPGDDVPGDDVSEVAQGAMNYICILAGPGKSVRLGISNDALQANGRTPATVCLSQHACLDIVSQAFDVKSVEKRGYCPNKNPHVVPLTDAQIQAKIGQ